MKTYFNNVETLEQLRSQYKKLLKQYHPDNENGSEEITKDINTEYERLFQSLKDRHEQKADNKTTSSNMKYDFAEDEKLREMLQKVIHFEGIEIEVCGAWLWISGNTYPLRKELKAFGFKFASQKKMWFWHSEAYQKKSHKTLSITDIRNYYGSTRVEQTDNKRLLEA